MWKLLASCVQACEKHKKRDFPVSFWMLQTTATQPRAHCCGF